MGSNTFKNNENCILVKPMDVIQIESAINLLNDYEIYEKIANQQD